MYIWLKKEKIKEYLIKNNITQQEFSEKLNLDKCYFSSLMNNKKNVSAKTRKKLQKLLNISVWDDLFYIKN